MLRRGTAANWTYQKLLSYMRNVTVFVDLTYLCCFQFHHHIYPCFFVEDKQRGWCVQKGFCLVLCVCFACRATLFFQTQLWKAKAHTAT